ncbi:MAG: ATP-binding protein, partial [Calditrichia bacterium]
FGFAQSHNEAGRPFITNYSPKDYGSHPQNWSIVQDKRGVMYFANGTGVLEYDGISWRLIPSPNNAYVQSLTIDPDSGTIYVGGQGNLGYLKPDSLGQMRYISLLDRISPEDRVFVNIWNAAVTKDGIYFQGFNRIFRWSENKMEVWKSDLRFLSSFRAGDTFYVHQSNTGLKMMVGDSLLLVPGGARFAGERIDAILPFDTGRILIITRSSGIFLYDGNSFRIFKTEAEPFLKENQTFNGAVLPDGTFAIATMRGGVVIIDKSGQVRQYLNEETGLLDNFVRYIYSDRHGSLWLALDSGIARIETPSPLSLYDKQSGLDSYVVFALRHQGILYVATGLGVYYLDAKDRKFKHVNGLVSRSWSLVSVGDQMLVATDDGIFSIKNRQARVIRASRGESFRAYSLHCSRQNSNRVFVGLIDGLASLRFDGSQWIDEGRIPGIIESIRSFAEDEEGGMWLGTQSKGAIFLQFPGRNSIKNPQMARYNKGLPKGGVSVFRIGNHDYFAMIEGMFRFDRQSRAFYRDTTFSSALFGGSQEEYTLKRDFHGNIWMNFGRETAVKIRQNDGSYHLQKKAFMQIDNMPVYFIYPEKDSVTWFGSEEALVRYDPRIPKNYEQDYPALIRQVRAGENMLLYGGGFEGNNPGQVPALSHHLNALRFEFSALSFEAESENQFKTWLEGFDKGWSSWSRESKKDYTNLPFGEYHFHVKAKNIFGHESSEAVYDFKILPPWHRTWWAYGIYTLLFLGLVFGIDRVQRRRLLKKEMEQARLRETELRAQAAEAQAKALQAENERKKNVELLSQIGREITASLDFETIFFRLYENVNQLVDAPVFGVGIYHPERHQIEYRLAIEKGKRYTPYTRDTRDKRQLPVWCIDNQKPVFINDVHSEYSGYIPEYHKAGSPQVLEDGTAADDPVSIIYFPLISQERVLGVITIQSFKKNAYSNYHFNILQNLAAYTAIALDNADAYRKLNTTIEQLNITLNELKSTQQQLITQEKLASLGALTAGIAHEIKNPLNFVNNFAELSIELVDELKEIMDAKLTELDSGARENLEEILNDLKLNSQKIYEHGRRADNIVRSMLQHSRGKTDEHQATDINAMLEDDINLAYHGMRAQDASFNVTISKKFDTSLAKLQVVPQDISRVFLNIIGNGFYAVNSRKKEQSAGFEPAILVWTQGSEDHVRIGIRDNGNGIPKSVQNKLFNPFFTTKPAGQGTGLGLSLSYDIVVKEHNGSITFETEEGKFTEFIISLPKNGVKP